MAPSRAVAMALTMALLPQACGPRSPGLSRFSCETSTVETLRGGDISVRMGFAPVDAADAIETPTMLWPAADMALEPGLTPLVFRVDGVHGAVVLQHEGDPSCAGTTMEAEVTWHAEIPGLMEASGTSVFVFDADGQLVYSEPVPATVSGDIEALVIGALRSHTNDCSLSYRASWEAGPSLKLGVLDACPDHTTSAGVVTIEPIADGGSLSDR